MGARISIRFTNKGDKSPVLFSHWGGEEFKDTAKDYIKKLRGELKEKEKGISDPLSRLEPCTVMVDFIRDITKDMDRVESDLYLGVDENDGDNSDYGHYDLELGEFDEEYNPILENTEEDKEHIAEQIKEGNTSGLFDKDGVRTTWKLEIDKFPN